MTFMPTVTEDDVSQTWWAALRQNKLMLQRDPESQKVQWYPRGHCLANLERAPEWFEASGFGSVFSFSVIHRGNVRLDGPYICALIQLDEGVLMLSRLVNIDAQHIRIGMEVQISFLQVSAEKTLPVFEPRSNA